MVRFRQGADVPENADIVASNKGIQVNGMNISELPEKQVTDEVPSVDNIDVEDDGSFNFDFDSYAGKATTADFFSSLLGDSESLDSKYPELVSWWDENIDDPYSESALSNRKKLKEHRDNPEMKFEVSDLEDFLKLREDSQFATDDEFVEHFKNCYL